MSFERSQPNVPTQNASSCASGTPQTIQSQDHGPSKRPHGTVENFRKYWKNNKERILQLRRECREAPDDDLDEQEPGSAQ